MDEFSNNDSNASFPDLYSSGQISKTNNENMSNKEKDHEIIRIEQQFNEMNRQIREPTILVKTLTEKISSNVTVEKRVIQASVVQGRQLMLTVAGLTEVRMAFQTTS